MCVSYRIREWHRSSVIVQIHSHTIKMLFNMKTRTWIHSVPHKPDTVLKKPPLPLVWCCSYSKTPVTLFNLHIPAVCSWVKTLWTQNTETQSNLSGLSGTGWSSSLSLTLIRSSDRTRRRWAVFGSRITGADETQSTDAVILMFI